MAQLTFDEAKKLVESVRHWHHSFEIFPGLQTPGTYNPAFLWNKLGLGENLHGLRALDIGASDGFFSRGLRERGADVVSVDYRDKKTNGFGVMERLYGETFDHRRANIYDLRPADLGTFDIILFLGVLYHLPDMMGALARVRSLARGKIYIESHSENDFCPNIAAARYYVHDTLNKDWTNFWAPNRLCLLDMIFDSGLDAVRDEAWGKRLLVETVVNENPERLRKLKVAYGFAD